MRISTAKSYMKDLVWVMPASVSRLLVEAACATHLLSRSYSVYHRMGRPTRVLSGPFQGMAYQPVAAGSSWLPKIIGCYERELHATIEWACARPFDRIVDVGSAEGYYAIGLARKILSAPIHCFDTDPRANALLMRNARLNGVEDRIVAAGFCSPATLDRLLRGSRTPLVVCDCEGGERDLLVPEQVPELRRAVILVEIHDYFGEDEIGRQIRDRFAPTHEIERVGIADRHREDLPAPLAATLSEEDTAAALAEGRPPTSGWLVLRPKG